MQSWEEWRQADAFHLLYDWLLVLLQERLLSSQGTHAGSVYIAWNQMLWVAALTFLLSLTSAARLVWLSFTSGKLTSLLRVMGMRYKLLSLCVHDKNIRLFPDAALCCVYICLHQLS